MQVWFTCHLPQVDNHWDRPVSIRKYFQSDYSGWRPSTLIKTVTVSRMLDSLIQKDLSPYVKIIPEGP